jgi:hypothetical protein
MDEVSKAAKLRPIDFMPASIVLAILEGVNENTTPNLLVLLNPAKKG